MTPAGADLHWQGLSPRLLTARRVEVAALAVPLALVGGLLGGVLGSALIGAVVGLGLAVCATVAERFLARRVRAWAFAERADDLLVRRGVLFRRLSVVPYGRMQFIDVTAGPVERTFGLSTLRMHTAAAASDARIPGLEHDVATRLRDQLAALGESRAAGL